MCLAHESDSVQSCSIVVFNGKTSVNTCSAEHIRETFYDWLRLVCKSLDCMEDEQHFVLIAQRPPISGHI